jgi:hypothetical protein
MLYDYSRKWKNTRVVVKYYLGSCEYKWTHAHTQLEHTWVRRELGDELFEQCNQDGFNLDYIRTASGSLPSDIYCRCDIHLDVNDGKDHTLFALKYAQVAKVEQI